MDHFEFVSGQHSNLTGGGFVYSITFLSIQKPILFPAFTFYFVLTLKTGSGKKKKKEKNAGRLAAIIIIYYYLKHLLND